MFAAVLHDPEPSAKAEARGVAAGSVSATAPARTKPRLASFSIGLSSQRISGAHFYAAIYTGCGAGAGAAGGAAALAAHTEWWVAAAVAQGAIAAVFAHDVGVGVDADANTDIHIAADPSPPSNPGCEPRAAAAVGGRTRPDPTATAAIRAAVGANFAGEMPFFTGTQLVLEKPFVPEPNTAPTPAPAAHPPP